MKKSRSTRGQLFDPGLSCSEAQPAVDWWMPSGLLTRSSSPAGLRSRPLSPSGHESGQAYPMACRVGPASEDMGFSEKTDNEQQLVRTPNPELFPPSGRGPFATRRSRRYVDRMTCHGGLGAWYGQPLDPWLFTGPWQSGALERGDTGS